MNDISGTILSQTTSSKQFNYSLTFTIIIIITYIIFVIKWFLPFKYDGLSDAIKNKLGADFDNSSLGYFYSINNSLVQNTYYQLIFAALITFIIFTLTSMNFKIPFFILALVAFMVIIILIFGTVNIATILSIINYQFNTNTTNKILIILATVLLSIATFGYFILLFDVFNGFLSSKNYLKGFIITISILTIIAIILLFVVTFLGESDQNLLLNKHIYRIVQTIGIISIIYLVLYNLKNKLDSLKLQIGNLQQITILFTSIFTDVLINLGNIKLADYQLDSQGLDEMITADISKDVSVLSNTQTSTDVISRLTLYFFLLFSNQFVNILSPTILIISIIIVIIFVVNILPLLGFNSNTSNKIRFSIIAIILSFIFLINLIKGIEIFQQTITQSSDT